MSYINWRGHIESTETVSGSKHIVLKIVKSALLGSENTVGAVEEG